jgi:exonuclease III
MNVIPEHLRLASLNVNGLRDARKRNDLLRWLRRERLDLVALQDIGFDEAIDDANQWCTFGGMRAFWTAHTAFIILNPLLRVEAHHVLNSRISILTLSINNFTFRVVSVYAPVQLTERNIFFNDVLSQLDRREGTIMMGDFNTYASNELDRYPPKADQHG